MKRLTVCWITGLVAAAAIAAPPAVATDADTALESVDAFCARQLNVCTESGPRLPVSYDGLTGFVDVAYVYDSSLALQYLLQRKQVALARDIGDALLHVQATDPHHDNRIRSAYRLSQSEGQGATSFSIFDPDAATGNISWVASALARLSHTTGEAKYLDGAVSAATWLDGHTRREDPMGGFAVGELGWSSTPFSYRVLEHQTDVVVLGENLVCLTGDARWRGMAQHARGLIDRLYADEQKHYWTGTTGADGLSINYWPIPADQVWVSLLSSENATRRNAVLDWVRDNLVLEEEIDGRIYHGVRFSSAGEHIHTEATAFYAAALTLAGRDAQAQTFLDTLECIRLCAPNHDPDGIGLVASPHPDGASTGYGFTYPNKLALAPTVWYGNAILLADGDSMANPFQPVPEPASGALCVVACGFLVLVRRSRKRLR